MSYSRVTSQYWTGATGRALRKESPWVRNVATYLMTCPSKSMTGLYYLPIPLLVHEVGCTQEEALEALERLRVLGFAEYDPEHELVFVVNMAREQVGDGLQESDNRVVYVRRLVQPYLQTELGRAWLTRYALAFHCQALGRGLQPLARARANAGAGQAVATMDQVEGAALDLDAEMEQLALTSRGGAQPDDGNDDELREELALAFVRGQAAGRVDRPAEPAELEQLYDDDEAPSVDDLSRDLARSQPAASDTSSAVAEVSKRAMEILSAAAGRDFRVTKYVRGDIAVLLAAGFSPDDIEAVIHAKARQWRFDPNMAEQLKPSILLGEKFERYLEEDVRAGAAMTPEEAWKVVSAEVQRVGRYGKASLEPIIDAAVKIAGWGNLCTATARDAQRMFTTAFKTAAAAAAPSAAR